MEKRMHKLNISDKLANLMPPLTKEEDALLTNSLLNEGCREPLVVWNGTIVDGHNRYRICWRHGVPFTYVEKNFESETEAMLWAVRNQMARRNLTDFQKCELVLPFEDALREEAKKRQCRRKYGLEPLSVKGDTRSMLAVMAGVSHGSFDKAKAIIASGNADLICSVRKGDVSIHRAYMQITAKSAKSRTPKEPVVVMKEPVVVMKEPAPVMGKPLESLLPIGDAVRDLLNRVTEGEATTKMIISELTRVAQMIDEVENGKESI